MNLTGKSATAVVERRFKPDQEALSGVSTSATGVTVDSATVDGDEIVLVLSGGTEGETASIAVTVTADAQTVVYTLYIPILPVGVLGETAREICAFALRKMTGLGVDPEAVNEEDALERLRDMLNLWRETGADIGAPADLDATTVIYCRNAWLSAVKNNLILQLADLYGAEPGPVVIENARRGVQAIKHANLPDERGGVSYL